MLRLADSPTGNAVDRFSMPDLSSENHLNNNPMDSGVGGVNKKNRQDSKGGDATANEAAKSRVPLSFLTWWKLN